MIRFEKQSVPLFQIILLSMMGFDDDKSYITDDRLTFLLPVSAQLSNKLISKKCIKLQGIFNISIL